MAKKTEKKPSTPSGFGDRKFINYRLDDADKAWLAEADLVQEYPLQRMFSLVEEGYKLSVSPASEGRSAIVSITDTEVSSPFYNHTLSGFGTNPIDAWYALAYRHFTKAEGDWAVFGSVSGGDVSRFG